MQSNIMSSNKTKTITLTEKQVEIVLYELEQGIMGDDPKDAYDQALKRIIKKIQES